ncbi:MAG: acyl-[acyl-carrier-protein] thioesterase [Lachnospiraceae bacterium]|nr:acyl-[acyl-carrier-protein] thioesterase [Lachnospiraceae bacterium]
MYEMKIRVPYNDIGPDAYMSLSGMINEFQNCSTFHSEDIGFGLRDMLHEHMGWYLISWQVHMYKKPVYGQEIIVDTMPYMLKGPFGNRNFVMKSPEGDVFAEANSMWILMNLKKDIPVRIPKKMQEAFGLDEPLKTDWPDRKIPLWEDREKVYDFEVSPMHVDTNGHMNNLYYIEGAIAALPKDFEPKEMYVEYKMQAKLKDKVVVAKVKKDDKIQVVLENSEKEVYAIIMFA